MLFRTETDKACNILMIKILTPTVSPHFLNASERNQKMPCISMRRFSLNFSLRGREMMTTDLFKREYFETRADLRVLGSGKVKGVLRYPLRWLIRSKEGFLRGFKTHFKAFEPFSSSSSFQLLRRAIFFFFFVLAASESHFLFP